MLLRFGYLGLRRHERLGWVCCRVVPELDLFIVLLDWRRRRSGLLHLITIHDVLSCFEPEVLGTRAPRGNILVRDLIWELNFGRGGVHGELKEHMRRTE